MPLTSVERVQALGDLQAIWTTFSLRQNLSIDTVGFCVGQMPDLQIRCFHLAVMGAGHCTPNFKVSSRVNVELLASLSLLYEAAGVGKELGNEADVLLPRTQELFGQFDEELKNMGADEVPVDATFKKYLADCPAQDEEGLARLMHTAAFARRGLGQIGGSVQQFLTGMLP